MSRHVVATDVTCPRCGSSAERIYVAEARSSGLRFSSSLTCRSCSLAEEEDGPELTKEARSAFYQSEGRWTACVCDLGPRRTEALQVLRTLRNETPAELARLVRAREPIVEGALVEVEQAEDLLKAVGADVVLSRLAG